MSETTAPDDETIADLEEAMRDVADPNWASTSSTSDWSTV